MDKIAFTKAVPVASIEDGLAIITLGDETHPKVACPVHVLRQFCEVSIRTIARWEREEIERRPVVPIRKR